MGVIVQKYGGSSVADVRKIGLVADQIIATCTAGHRVVVVVSAMGKTTDGLVALANDAAATGASPGAPARRELDMLVSTGERVTMALLSIALQARGCDAISFTGSQSGIITSDRHFDARIIEVRPFRIEEELARGKVVIVAGYQGMSTSREITTLGRGGSDTTAVALAAALGAERCEIYSDVDGVYSADPRVVPDARHLPELSLDVLSEMAEAGAKVLNAQAVEWARRAGVTIVARRTGDGAGARETVAVQSTKATVVAVSAMVQVATLFCEEAMFADLVGAAARLEIPLLDAKLVPGRAWVAVPLLNLPDWPARRRSLETMLEGKLEERGTCALVSVVGDGLTTHSGALAALVSTLGGAGVALRSLSAAPLRISAFIDDERVADAQRALHACFSPRLSA